jgi:hypothetical protein
MIAHTLSIPSHVVLDRLPLILVGLRNSGSFANVLHRQLS